MVVPNVPVWGNEMPAPYGDYWQGGDDITVGTVYNFGNYGDQPASTGESGVYIVNNGREPAYWDIDWLEPEDCGNNSDPSAGPIFQGNVSWDGLWWWQYNTSNALVYNYYPDKLAYTATCVIYNMDYASRRLAILGNLPSTLTLGSEIPLTTQFGMPLLYVYDKNSNVAATETATSVSSDGTQATFPFPSSLAQSGYSLAILNQAGSAAGLVPAGVNLLSVASSQTIAGNPFGVAAQAVTTAWQSADNDDPYGDGTCQGQWVYDSGSYTNSSPVVTEYSLNQVNNGGTTIPVGPNPTAIAAYDPQVSHDNQDDGPCHQYRTDTTQMTRAIVANSGNNTVSILDIVNNAVLSTITVGNQPVALAVTSDGSIAYVANYGDSTVTEVNLNTDTPITTIPVGGQPTSVALTATGTLWVGGAGLLTEINTQNMSVVATQSTGGETIAGLGYSDQENELVTTTMDTNGNVMIDEVSPSTVQTGMPYTTVASHSVSTLGSYFNPRTHTQVRGFTGTLSQSMVPVNSNQPGAPPLVVQDGWAVVTATPTGFTITDASGHIVLVSETTPSPIAAIAVDTNLNAAYLTMPDSNTLLTVPLPGTGSN